MNNKDWHTSTQNSDYLELSTKRLGEPPLIWVNQFTKIINQNINIFNSNQLKINDVGCNVGHFARNLNLIHTTVGYKGIDISETYLEIAQGHFPHLKFIIEDFSRNDLLLNQFECDLTILSATLEHIEDFQQFLKNIFLTTKKMVIIRTFVGDDSKQDQCLKEGAANSYLIRQFRIEDLVEQEFNHNWSFETQVDEATKGEPKELSQSIVRKQLILIFKRK